MKTPLIVLAIGVSATGCHPPDPQPEPRSATRLLHASHAYGVSHLDDLDIAAIRERVIARAAVERQKLAEDQRLTDRVAAQGAYEVAVAKAEGGHKTLIESCKTLAAATRRNCRDRADTALRIARAEAEKLRPSS